MSYAERVSGLIDVLEEQHGFSAMVKAVLPVVDSRGRVFAALSRVVGECAALGSEGDLREVSSLLGRSARYEALAHVVEGALFARIDEREVAASADAADRNPAWRDALFALSACAAPAIALPACEDDLVEMVSAGLVYTMEYPPTKWYVITPRGRKWVEACRATGERR